MKIVSARTAVALAAAFAASVAVWAFLGRAQDVPGGLAPGQRIECVSYTPLQGAETPAEFSVDPARLERDFALLSRQVGCIRLYSMKGMERVPEVARRYGLQVIAGAWVNREQGDTEREIEALIEVANRYPDTIRAVLVGNEVLLRREASAATLAGYLRRVRGAVRQPVSYGDVWEFWLQNSELGAEVEFLTIHLLPYWENDPTGIDGAIEAVARARTAIVARFPGKEVLIGETGWPSEGRRREDAQPGRVEEARFVRGFVARARSEGWHYNLIEAFDQPWKRAQEGAVGGYWGLFDAGRNDKHILRGQVAQIADWNSHLGVALGLLIALLALGRTSAPRALAIDWLVANGVAMHLQQMSLYSRGMAESLWFLLLAAAALLAALLWSARCRGQAAPSWHDAALVLIAGLAATELLGLAFDARYRHFPYAVFAGPACVVGALGIADPVWRARGRALALAMLPCLPALLWQETPANGEALVWLALCGLMLAGLLRRGAQPPSRSAPLSASASMASTAAGAP